MSTVSSLPPPVAVPYPLDAISSERWTRFVTATSAEPLWLYIASILWKAGGDIKGSIARWLAGGEEPTDTSDVDFLGDDMEGLINVLRAAKLDVMPREKPGTLVTPFNVSDSARTIKVEHIGGRFASDLQIVNVSTFVARAARGAEPGGLFAMLRSQDDLEPL